MSLSAHSRSPSQGAVASSRAGQAATERPSARTRTVIVYMVLALLALVPGVMLRLEWSFGGSLADAPLQALRHSLDAIEFGFGLRFWLGVAGFTMMALLVLYPLRKAIAAHLRVGSVGAWFHVHMILGLAGPVLILYHANFGHGGRNANVALWTMLIVVVSGIIGHFVYTTVSAEFYAGKEKARQQLEAISATLTNLNCRQEACRRYLADLEAFEADLLTPRQGIAASLWARWRVESRRRVLAKGAANLLRDCAAELRLSPADYQRLRAAIGSHFANYVRFARHAASRSVREQVWARWRLFHLPVFLIMLAATSLHIYAVWDHEALFVGRKQAVAEAVAPSPSPAPTAPVVEKKSAPSTVRGIEQRTVSISSVPARSETAAASPPESAPKAAPVKPEPVAKRDQPPRPKLKPEATIADLIDDKPSAAPVTPPAPIQAKPPVKQRVTEAVPKSPAPEPAAKPQPPAPPATAAAPAPAATVPPPTVEERTAMKELQRRTDDQRMALGGAKPRTLAEQIAALKEKQRLQQFFHSEAETGFPLTGKHTRLDCTACHKAPLHDVRQAKVRTCIDCHRKDDIHRGKRPDCAQCHTTNRWSQIVRRK